MGSRAEAVACIERGEVLVSGALATKASRLVDPAEPVVLTGPGPRYVSRGGAKLEHALEVFGIDVTGWRALDVGASTGGFTDCLLQHGARQVVALDVGHGQLDARLRSDPRVVVRERTHIRDVTVTLTEGPVDIVVCDVSFISLRHVVGPALAVCRPGGMMVLLVKPQFEAGRREADRGRGVITDPAVWDRVVADVDALLRSAGCTEIAWTESPILGSGGNREFLVGARTPVGDRDGS